MVRYPFMLLFLAGCGGRTFLTGDGASEADTADDGRDEVTPEIPTEIRPVAAWARTYGGPYDDGAWVIRQTPDNEFVVLGMTTETNVDFSVLRLDPAGNVIWQKQYDGGDDDYGYGLWPTSGGGFVVAGTSSEPMGINFFFVMKLNDNGNVEWLKQYGKAEDLRGIQHRTAQFCDPEPGRRPGHRRLDPILRIWWK